MSTQRQFCRDAAHISRNHVLTDVSLKVVKGLADERRKIQESNVRRTELSVIEVNSFLFVFVLSYLFTGF